MYKNLKKILVVDPSPDFRLLVASALVPLKVLQADNGLQAISLLKQEKVDMLISEFRLPEKSGVELLHWCRSRDIHIPVLFMVREERLLKAEEVALADCCATLLRKPLSSRALVQAVRAADERNPHENCLHHYQGIISREIHI